MSVLYDYKATFMTTVRVKNNNNKALSTPEVLYVPFPIYKSPSSPTGNN